MEIFKNYICLECYHRFRELIFTPETIIRCNECGSWAITEDLTSMRQEANK
jgi:DNA-directed RNA polymerase subunit RPC12/RpoP